MVDPRQYDLSSTGPQVVRVGGLQHSSVSIVSPARICNAIVLVRIAQVVLLPVPVLDAPMSVVPLCHVAECVELITLPVRQVSALIRFRHRPGDYIGA